MYEYTYLGCVFGSDAPPVFSFFSFFVKDTKRLTKDIFDLLYSTNGQVQDVLSQRLLFSFQKYSLNVFTWRPVSSL